MVLLISLCLALVFTITCGDILRKKPVPFYIGAIVISVISIMLTWSDYQMPTVVDEWIIPILAGGGLTGALFVIVMYAGAFPNRSLGAKTFIPLRGPLSIIASIIGIGHGIAYGLSYYKLALNGLSGVKTSVVVFIILSVIMQLIMLPLFITSFMKVRRRMNGATWKKLQRLAYPFYALLYVHVMMLMVPPALRGERGYDITVFVYSFIFISYFAMRIVKALGTKSAESLPKRQMVTVALALLVSTVAVAGINESADKKLEESMIAETIEQSSTMEASSLKDGTFYGEGMGNNGTITVEVTINNGEISNIVFTKFNDDKEYFDTETDGKEMIDQMLQSQSSNVDAIAGATYSSEGFIAAVEDALEQAGQ